MEKEMKNKKKVVASTSAQHHVTEKNVGPYANIPDDLVIEILKRLPAKSILRFKTVCKQWLSTTQDPAFISSHNKLAHMRSDGGGSVLIFSKTQQDHDPCLFSAPYEGGQASSLLHPNHIEKLYGYIASPPTQGLVLLFPGGQHYAAEYKIYVFNPTTRELVPLPPLDKVIHQEEQLEEIARKEDWLSPIIVNYYLGYDPYTETYKVLSICSSNSYVGRYRSKNLFYVFTLGDNEYWRKLDTPSYLQTTKQEVDSYNCCVNGSIYFIAPPPSYGQDQIVAFDIGKEEFRLIQSPSPQYWSLNNLKQLGKHLMLCGYNNKVVLILEDQIWTCVNLHEIIKWKYNDIAGGTQLPNKYYLMIANEDVDQDEDVDEDEEENEVGLSIAYCDKSIKEWSEFKITCLTDKKLYGFRTTNNIETLFSPSVLLR